MSAKKSRAIVCTVTILAVIFIFAINNGYSAQISFMAGDVKVIRDGKEMKAQFQMKLDSGDVLKTGKMAFADVSYEDGTLIKVKENSSVTIGSKSAEGSDALSVTGGLISAKFAKLQKGSERKVYTPTTVCAVRGTEFDVAVSESADSNIQLSEGALALLNPYGITSIKKNQNAEARVGSSPKLTKGGDLEEWKAENESQLDNNPEKQSNAFEKYLQTFENRNKNASSDINRLEKNQNAAATGGKEKMEKANAEIEDIHANVEDDMYLNAAANKSIDGILNRFAKDKKDMYDIFLKIKEESNKVLEQQKKNYEAIMAVKEAYKKAYEEIMKKHKDAIDKIKGSIDLEGVKPKK